MRTLGISTEEMPEKFVKENPLITHYGGFSESTQHFYPG
jgi:hypothetical protein